MHKELIEELITNYLDPEFRGRLIDRGLARSMIWENGILPENASDFSDELTYDLLSYGYSLLSLAIKSIENKASENLRNQAFEKAATALMTVIYNGETNYTKFSFHTLMCASAYHLAHYSAKSYSLLKKTEEYQSKNILEKSLRLLLTRDFDGLLANIPRWKFSLKSDLDLLVNDEKLNELDEASIHLSYLNSVLVDRYLEVIYEYLDLLEIGNNKRLESINRKLNENIAISLEYNFIEDWWIYRITLYLINDLWDRTYHNLLPIEPNDPDWTNYRNKFIRHLLKKKNAEIDLWPSQIEGAKKAVNDSENLVISLPTSAGKTRIAELCILKALSQKKKVIFITPLRALSVQTEITLMNTFSDLGTTVSSLYGGLSLYGYQRQQFADSDILIGTPEKLDFLLKHDPELLNDVGLIVIDEGHMIGPGEREVKFEVLIQSLLNRYDSDTRRIVCLSAILPSGQELNDFVSWISHKREGQAVSINWRPTDLRFGIVYPNASNLGFRLDYVIGTQKPFIPQFINKIPITEKSNFPDSQQELCLSIADKFIQYNQSILVYCPSKRSVNALAKTLVKLNNKGILDFKNLNIDSQYFKNALRIADELFGSNHYIVGCLKLGVVIHHGGLPTEYRTAVELLLKNCKINLIIASPTLAQGLNLQVNVVLFQSIYRFRNLIPQPEFKNVIGRAGRSFVDMQGIVLFANYDNKTYKAQAWEDLIKGKEQLSLASGLKSVVLNLLVTLFKNLKEDNIEKFYEYIVNTNFSFSLDLSENDSQNNEELNKWQERLNLLDYSIINLIGDKDIEIFEIADHIDAALQSSLFYRQIQHFGDKKQTLFKVFVQKRAQYLWIKTTSDSRKQLYLSGVSLETIDNNNSIIEEIFIDLILIQSILKDPNSSEDPITKYLIELSLRIFSIKEFKHNDSLDANDIRLILDNWLTGNKYFINDNIDAIVNFIEKDVSYTLIWALEFIKSRCNMLHEFLIEDETFDFISQAFEYGMIDKCAIVLMQLGMSSRLQAQNLANYLSFTDSKQMTQWISEIDIDSLQDQLDSELIASLRKIINKINPFNQVKIMDKLTEEPVIWLVDDPESYMFTNLKLINIGSETFILSNKAEAIGKLKKFISLELIKILNININYDVTVNIRYQYFN